MTFLYVVHVYMFCNVVFLYFPAVLPSWNKVITYLLTTYLLTNVTKLYNIIIIIIFIANKTLVGKAIQYNITKHIYMNETYQTHGMGYNGVTHDVCRYRQLAAAIFSNHIHCILFYSANDLLKGFIIPSPTKWRRDIVTLLSVCLSFHNILQILLRTKYVLSLVIIHWRMLILEISQGCYAVKIWPGDLDLWPWKSIGFQILLRIKYVPNIYIGVLVQT
jgi:hypothetical protein